MFLHKGVEIVALHGLADDRGIQAADSFTMLDHIPNCQASFDCGSGHRRVVVVAELKKTADNWPEGIASVRVVAMLLQ